MSLDALAGLAPLVGFDALGVSPQQNRVPRPRFLGAICFCGENFTLDGTSRLYCGPGPPIEHGTVSSLATPAMAGPQTDLLDRPAPSARSESGPVPPARVVPRFRHHWLGAGLKWGGLLAMPVGFILFCLELAPLVGAGLLVFGPLACWFGWRGSQELCCEHCQTRVSGVRDGQCPGCGARLTE